MRTVSGTRAGGTGNDPTLAWPLPTVGGVQRDGGALHPTPTPKPMTKRRTISRAVALVFGGKHAIHFPAAAICDPATSSYGAGTWDDPCDAAGQPVRISLRAYRDGEGLTHVYFEPALRFNPATSGVFLFLQDANKTISPWFKEIYYCSSDASCIDEAVDDPSLTTYYDPRTNLHSRRVKHFSGYVVGVGRSEEAY